MDSFATVELAQRKTSTLFDVGPVVCTYDGGCRRRNPRHWLECCHPVDRTKLRCEHLLRLRACPHLDHRCNHSCARPCPHRDAATAHCEAVYHGPSVSELERCANGEPTKRPFGSTTTTTTVTVSTTTTTTAVVETAPKRARTGGKLSDSFIAPPFSVLDASAGYWQSRKREWFAMGLDGGAGRDDELLGVGLSALTPGLTGTSIFDPVLVECALQWYAPKPSRDAPVVIIDPFAGGSTRGVVCAKLGLLYVGTDVSERQVHANRQQAIELCGDCKFQPRWAVSCGSKIEEVLAVVLAEHYLPVDTKADMMITCPPYFNLELYDGDPSVDLSMFPSYEAFLARYDRILSTATALLKPQHVAVVVVGNVRDSTGQLLDLHGDTKRILLERGNPLYCDAVLRTATASAAMRAGRQMAAASKLCTVHQNVIVTCRDVPLTPADARLAGIRAGEA